MSIIKTTLVAASLVAFAAAAHAQSREDLNSGYHGNTPVWNAPVAGAARSAIPQSARDAYARAGAPIRAQAPQTFAVPQDPVNASEANPLLDRYHGN